MKKFRIYILFCSALFFAFNAKAENDWFYNLNKLPENLSDDAFCQKSWEIVWPAAKTNVEARFYLIYDLLYGSSRELPGRTGDSISRIRDFRILLAHSADINLSNTDFKKLYEDLGGYKMFESAFSEYAYSDFLNCVKEKKAGCSEIAVKDHIVPSFEDFAAEIDANIARGEKSSCSFSYIKGHSVERIAP